MTRAIVDIGNNARLNGPADHDDIAAAPIKPRRKRERIPDAWPRGMALEVAAAYVGVAPSTWLREVAGGRAPKPIPITEGRRVWLREQVDKWLDQFAGTESDWRAELEEWAPSK